jgi:hypothetical protein
VANCHERCRPGYRRPARLWKAWRFDDGDDNKGDNSPKDSGRPSLGYWILGATSSSSLRHQSGSRSTLRPGAAVDPCEQYHATRHRRPWGTCWKISSALNTYLLSAHRSVYTFHWIRGLTIVATRRRLLPRPSSAYPPPRDGDAFSEPADFPISSLSMQVWSDMSSLNRPFQPAVNKST